MFAGRRNALIEYVTIALLILEALYYITISSQGAIEIRFGSVRDAEVLGVDGGVEIQASVKIRALPR